jgi:diguanylate cyclase (GGDEF)-like protein
MQLLEDKCVDLIISDVDMPGLGGFETVQLMREILGNYWLPIIILTSRNEDDDYLSGFNAGADDYLLKPVKEVVLQSKINVMERFIAMRNERDELRNAPAPPSQYDQKTHCYTQHAFLEMSAIQWRVMARREEPVTMLEVEIDYFKQYQEHYGDEKTEKAILGVSEAIREAVHRPTDFIGRVAENRFLLMLSNTEHNGATAVATRISDEVDQLCIEHKRSLKMGSLSVTVSGVVSMFASEHGLEDNLEKLQFSHRRRVSQHESISTSIGQFE